NAEFAEICQRSGIKFIGPEAKSIRLLGDKSEAKRTMKENGVPTIPGSDGEVESLEAAKALAQEIGFPLLIKASAGGGGRGMRVAESINDLERAYKEASDEAKAYFGNGGVYMEKLLTSTKHIEFQILADEMGNVIHLFERDCSMQRRKQKVIEETPCVVLSEETRQKMGEAAVRAAKSCGYSNAGTVEFLLDHNNNFYFMEMNTRVQVEHPITEMVTGIDIVKKQIEIAAGQPLGINQSDVQMRGHSIECRINAEDPDKGFRPTFGRVHQLFIPGGNGVRFDTQLYQDYELPVYYDSMVGKLIVLAPTRNDAIAKMKAALSEMIIDGIKTNVLFQYDLINSSEFKSGRYTTDTIEQLMSKK
ncbi:MAG TPA: ATP-grasp domain-containing protein, partial [Firmicutes bacterium]|nr:ATP-grasp domain-containing protein [Bacillota bacterium]